MNAEKEIEEVVTMICKIRNWKIENAANFAIVLNNKKIHSILAFDSNATFAFAITVDDKAIGSIGVFRKENIHSLTAEMGYYSAEPYWGKGLGTSAVKQTCKFVFSNADIIRIFAEPFAQNAASCRIIEKAGLAKGRKDEVLWGGL